MLFAFGAVLLATSVLAGTIVCAAALLLSVVLFLAAAYIPGDIDGGSES
jgi:hypothetical protein